MLVKISADDPLEVYGIYHLLPREPGYPQNLSNLLCKLRALRAELGLEPVKLLGTNFTPDVNLMESVATKQAKHVDKQLTYLLDGVMYNTCQEVARAIRRKVRAHWFDHTEVLAAANISLRAGTAYLFGHLPKGLSLYILAVLAETVSMQLEFVLTDEPDPLTNTVN